MRLTLGIDIGVDGAIAVFDDEGRFVEVFDLPTMEGAIGKQTRRVINSLALHGMLLRRSGPIDGTIALIERVHAMPMNGSVATFSQGHSLGSVTTVLALLGIACELVQPTAWKKAVGLPAKPDKKQKKEIARCAAIRLYPEAAPFLERVRDHNRADAILIGRYHFAH